MNLEQSNQLRMFLSTQDYMDQEVQWWSRVPRLVTYKNDFDELIGRIMLKADETKEGNGIFHKKKDLKLTLSVKVSALSGALQAYAHEKGDIDLAEAVKITKSELAKLRDQDVEAIVNKQLKIAEEKLDELADYGITADILTEIKTSLEDFKSLIGKPRVILNQKYVAIASLAGLFDETNSLLKDKLDKLMLMFRDTNSEFYDGYQRARTIVDA